MTGRFRDVRKGGEGGGRVVSDVTDAREGRSQRRGRLGKLCEKDAEALKEEGEN